MESQQREFSAAIQILEEHWYTDCELAAWIAAPNPRFDGLTPLQMLAAGRKEEVLQYIREIDEGVYL